MGTKENSNNSHVTEWEEESFSLLKKESLPKRIKLMTIRRVISAKKRSPCNDFHKQVPQVHKSKCWDCWCCIKQKKGRTAFAIMALGKERQEKVAWTSLTRAEF